LYERAGRERRELEATPPLTWVDDDVDDDAVADAGAWYIEGCTSSASSPLLVSFALFDISSSARLRFERVLDVEMGV